MRTEWEARFRGFIIDRDERGSHAPDPDELE